MRTEPFEESGLSRTLTETLSAPKEYCPHDRYARSEIKALLFDALSGKHLMLVILRYEEDWTFEEIAEEMRISKVTVWKMHERIRRILLAELASRGIFSRQQAL